MLTIKKRLQTRQAPATPACSKSAEPVATHLWLKTVVTLVDCSEPFKDRFGRDHSVMWTTVEDPDTGHQHRCLFNLKFWPDPHYLELAIGCRVKVEPDSDVLRGSGWDRQPEELKDEVIRRLEAGQSSMTAPIEEVEEELLDSTPDAEPESDQALIINGAYSHMATELGSVVTFVAEQCMTRGIPIAAWVCLPPERGNSN